MSDDAVAVFEEVDRSLEIERRETAESPRRNWARINVIAGGLLAFAVLSIFVLSRLTADPVLLGGVRNSLNDQQATVGGLAAGATALSAALSLVPQGALEPLANQLADVSGWFVVIIASIILQKILITVAGPVAFGLIVPLACVLGIIALYTRRVAFRSLSIRFAAFGLVLCFAVPASILISNALTSTYAGLTSAGAAAEDAADEAEDAIAEDAAAAEEAAKPADDGDDSLLDSVGDWISGAADDVGDAVGGALNSLNDIKDDAVGALNSYMEKFALLVVTTCVIPLLVMLLLGWVIKLLFSIDIAVGRIGHTLQAHASRGTRAVGRTASRRRARG
ncbi:hypothetical protein [uncultured Microbacterium sp.]|uniref:hypothetical protein n=1 Tax=uncultured Microbacterium sp. TaxID=191216 RepID=UPI0026177137|nr:hypothetical protein [uncultured Microbacterium sp.]